MTDDIDNLAGRLRKYETVMRCYGFGPFELVEDAAAALLRLRDERDEARKANPQPFNLATATQIVAALHVARDQAEARAIAAEARAERLEDACRAAKALLINDLVEPGRTVFWKLVDALAKVEQPS